MEIEVGRYGRTNTGKIFIFAWLEKSEGIRDKNKVLLGNGKTFENKFYYFEENEEIVKHSKKLIDLIEVGDYVNGYRVTNVINEEPCPSGKCVDIDSSMQSEECTFWEEDIKSIVTKEQFASIEYRIEEDKSNETN